MSTDAQTHVQSDDYAKSTGRTVWIFNDLPVGVVAGASLMIERWNERLPEFGLIPRLVTPSGTRRAERTKERITFRTVRHIGYPGDWHSRFSLFAELRRAAHELPDAIVVSTPLRAGTLGLAMAAFYKLPLIIVHSSDTSTMAKYHGSFRAMASNGSKLIALEMVSPSVRREFWGYKKLRSAIRDRKTGGDLIIAVHGMKAIYAHADVVVVLGEKTAREVRQWGLKARVRVIPIGVDRLSPVQDPIDIEWPHGRLRLLYVGRFSSEKNVSLLIHSLRAALDRGLAVHLVLVGEGHERTQLELLASKLGVTDHVDILGPFPHSKLQTIFAGADVFVFPSLSDSQAMALNEAAHEGLPILGCDPHVNAVLVDEVTGLIAADDPYAWAAALKRLTDPVLRKKLGTEAKERANAMTEKGQLAQFSAVIHDAIDAQAARPHRRINPRTA